MKDLELNAACIHLRRRNSLVQVIILSHRIASTIQANKSSYTMANTDSVAKDVKTFLSFPSVDSLEEEDRESNSDTTKVYISQVLKCSKKN